MLVAFIALTTPGVLFELWRSFRSPAAALDSSQLKVWGPIASKPTVISLHDVARIERESWNAIEFRLRSGKVRSLPLVVGKRERAEFLTALRETLAQRPPS